MNYYDCRAWLEREYLAGDASPEKKNFWLLLGYVYEACVPRETPFDLTEMDLCNLKMLAAGLRENS